MTPDTPSVGIIGLGLIGGSLARDLVRRGIDVIAHDTGIGNGLQADDADLARICRVDDAAAVTDAPVVVIAVPVRAAMSVLRRLAPRLGEDHLVMDVGSTKRHVVATAEALGLGPRFVGCHPLAGDHRSGWAASRAGLFEGASVFLCPASGADDRTVRRAAAFWEGVGARPEAIDAESHDHRMAWVSHLPHVLSTTMALVLRDAGLPVGSLGPGGRDVTRLAGSSPDLWTQIVTQNRQFLADALGRFEGELNTLRRALEAAEEASIRRHLQDAADWAGARPAEVDAPASVPSG